MKTLVEFIKELGMFIMFTGIISIVFRLFFGKTLVGKLVTILVKDLWMTLKLILRVTKYSGRLSYKYSKKAYKILNKQYKKYDNKKQTKKTKKKVANGEFENVIDLKKFMAEKQQNKSR